MKDSIFSFMYFLPILGIILLILIVTEKTGNLIGIHKTALLQKNNNSFYMNTKNSSMKLNTHHSYSYRYVFKPFIFLEISFKKSLKRSN